MDLAALFGGHDQTSRIDLPQARMLPAQQRLDAVVATVPQVELGLVNDVDLAARQGAGQLALQEPPMPALAPRPRTTLALGQCRAVLASGRPKSTPKPFGYPHGEKYKAHRTGQCYSNRRAARVAVETVQQAGAKRQVFLL